jgi:hypothetical protein
MSSEAQRRWMHANHPEMAKRWEAHTPKDKKLPEKVKNAFLLGVADAYDSFGLKTAAAEVRLKIPKCPDGKFHGFDKAFKDASDAPKKANDEAMPTEGTPEGPVDRLTEMLQQLPAPKPPLGDARKDPLERDTMWGGPSSLSGGDAGSRVSDMGQPTAVGSVF